MARCAFVLIIAPVFIGACVAATAQTTRDATQTMRGAPSAREGRAPARDAPAPTIAKADRPAAPANPHPAHAHTAEDKSKPRTVSPPFTRTIDRARIEARGASRIEARYDPRFAAAAFRAAIPFDDRAWTGDQRRELLAYLRGHPVAEDASFTESDVRMIAQLQVGSGGASDGLLGDEAVAVLLAAGLRIPVRKAAPSEVKLDFYPGELEDIDAWNREIAEKITKNGGDYNDVEPPAGEGTIYVRVGGSIVASYRARGGPPSAIEHGEHIAVPTTPGAYRLGPGHTHVTSNWYYSQIPWGAEVRKNEGGYQFRSYPRGKWAWATPHPESPLKEPIAADEFEDLPEVARAGVTYRMWNKNDFGPIAWNLVPSDQYVHTTPTIEAESADAAPNTLTSLGFSHGCIHIHPRERDEMMKRGYLGQDIAFHVRRWDEHVLPDEIRHEMTGHPAVAETRGSRIVCAPEATSATAACSPEASP